MSSAFINDGYTLKSSIPALPGVCPEVAFGYRLCKIGRRLQYSNAAGMGPESQAADGSRLIREFLTEITVRNEAGQWERVDLEAGLVDTLHPNVWLGIIAHITGSMGPTPAADAPKSLPG